MHTYNPDDFVTLIIPPCIEFAVFDDDNQTVYTGKGMARPTMLQVKATRDENGLWPDGWRICWRKGNPFGNDASFQVYTHLAIDDGLIVQDVPLYSDPEQIITGTWQMPCITVKSTFMGENENGFAWEGNGLMPRTPVLMPESNAYVRVDRDGILHVVRQGDPQSYATVRPGLWVMHNTPVQPASVGPSLN